MRLSRIGLGTWAFGGGGWPHGWGRQDDADSVATIHAALAAGVNWIDTAAVYGRGHAEEVVGRALRSLPDDERPYVFTKAGRQWRPDDLGAPLQSVLTPENLARDVEGSLARLGVERLDLLQVHWPATDGAPVEEYWGHVLALRDAGKVRCAGLSNHWLAQLEAAQAIGQVDSVQLPLSLLKPQARAEAEWSASHNAGFLAYSPLQSGLLSGRMSNERVARLPEDDWRRRAPEFAADRLEANLHVGAQLAVLARQRGVEAPVLAVAWVLACPGVTGAIVGARRPDQVEGWQAAMEYEMRPEEAALLAALRDTAVGA
jgi:aryl-alcohol dehydrogenase-like predicted oxidoreductase